MRWDGPRRRRTAGIIAIASAAALALSASGLAPSATASLAQQSAASEPGAARVTAGDVRRSPGSLRWDTVSPESPDEIGGVAPDEVPNDPTVGKGAPDHALPAGGWTPAAPGGEIPELALRAYQAAALALRISNPQCGLDFALLAGIGRVESNHGRYAGARLGTDGVSRPLIIGIALDGRPGVARIGDSDGGMLDGDRTFDRAVGPMQFIPGTWARGGADGDGDGRSDPHNIYDAALAAARYLCAGGARVDNRIGALAALMRYNRSAAYGLRVLGLADGYRSGVTVDQTPPAQPTAPAGAPGVVVALGPPVAPPAAPATGPVGPPQPATAPADPATGPAAPAQPATTPADPATTPADPTTGPADPTTGPVDPTTGPVDPAGPADPVDPTDPVDPVHPTDPTGPPVCPLPPATTGTPAATGDPTAPGDPAPTGTPAGTGTPATTGDPTATGPDGVVLATATVGEPTPAAGAGDPPLGTVDPCDPVAYATQLVALTNAARVTEGLAPLVRSGCVETAAIERVGELAGLEVPTPARLADVIAACAPATRAAENLSRAAATPSDVAAGWLASAPGRANLLDPALTEVGVACRLAEGEMRCVQLLVGP